MKAFSLVLFCFIYAASVYGQTSTWTLYSFAKGGVYNVSPTDMGFVFPEWSRKAAFPAFLSTTTYSSVLGNLSNKTISATVTITASPSALFVFGGELSGWNTTDPRPATGRLWFSTNATAYNVAEGMTNEHKFWWSETSYFVCTNNLGTVTITDTLDPLHWTSAWGHYGSDPSLIEKFNAAVANVRQIGIAFGGGCCYDVGVGLSPRGGPASFRLESFVVQ